MRRYKFIEGCHLSETTPQCDVYGGQIIGREIFRAMRIAPADVAAKNRLGCVSPNDAIYGNNGCPVRRCGANQGVVPLPQPSR